MKLTIFTGSGHANSTSFKLSEMIAEEIKNQDPTADITLYNAVELNVHDCLGCDYCLTHQNQCVISDQMDEIYREITETDIIIFVSAVYFSNFPAVLKRVIDRCQLFYNLKDRSFIKPKKALALSIGGAPHYKGQFDAFTETYRVLLPDFNAELTDFIRIPNTDKVDVLKDQSTLDMVKSTVHKLIR